VTLEKKHEENVVDDIEQRLLKLKGQGSPPNVLGGDSASRNVDLDPEPKTEQEEVDQIMQRVRQSRSWGI